jgi:hypothetical protein
MNKLNIFVASDKRVGMYINIITHAVNHYNVSRINFIKLTNCETLNDFDIVKFVRTTLYGKLRELSNKNPDVYKKAYDIFSGNKDKPNWDYLMLKKEVRSNGITERYMI